MDINNIDFEDFNKAIHYCNNVYTKKMHNLFFNNCHSHISMILNMIKYKNKDNWNMIDICVLMNTESEYINYSSILKPYILYIIIFILYFVYKIILSNN